MGIWVDISGKRYGLLVVKEYLGGSKWRSICDCGGESVTVTNHLKSGNTTSCGCRKKSVLGESTTKHGMAGTPTHRTWKAMRNRCNNPNTPRYKDYGGRGITVCERWDKFENFLIDMGERPEGMSIDRVDNNKGYSKSNCKWATGKEQRANMRDSIIVNGKSLTQIASKLGITYHAAYKRLKKNRLE